MQLLADILATVLFVHWSVTGAQIALNKLKQIL